MAKVVAFDIDGVLTEDADTKHDDLAGTYIYRTPRARAKEVILKAFESGWTVQLFTGRREAQRRITEDWLHANGFHYHFLTMGKPYYTVFIDDRIPGVSVEEQLRAFEVRMVEEIIYPESVHGYSERRQAGTTSTADEEATEEGGGREAERAREGQNRPPTWNVP